MNTFVIIPAAGAGVRFGSHQKKQYFQIQEKPILYYSIKTFEDSDLINKIIIVVPEEDISFCKDNIIAKFGFKKVEIVAGGKKRQDSVYNGLIYIKKPCDYVFIHDGVRPLFDGKMIPQLLDTAKKTNACIVGVPLKDTIKEISKENIVVTTPNRENFWRIQTPQVFKFDLIKECYIKAKKDGFYGTDSASLLERYGHEVVVVEGSYDNVKITTKEDIGLADNILKNVIR